MPIIIIKSQKGLAYRYSSPWSRAWQTQMTMSAKQENTYLLDEDTESSKLKSGIAQIPALSDYHIEHFCCCFYDSINCSLL